MGCGVVRAVGFENGIAFGTDIETGVGQAVGTGLSAAKRGLPLKSSAHISESALFVQGKKPWGMDHSKE